MSQASTSARTPPKKPTQISMFQNKVSTATQPYLLDSVLHGFFHILEKHLLSDLALYGRSAIPVDAVAVLSGWVNAEATSIINEC